MNNPIQSFHPTTFGKNIQLQENFYRAVRNTSFDHGITFSKDPVNINERIHITVIDTDETRQWCGSLAIGFTQLDPNSVNKDDLPKSTLPHFNQNNKRSYVKRLYETLTKNLCIIFYYNTEGAYYILDGEEKEIIRGIDIQKPLWAIVDIYGNVKGVTFSLPIEVIEDGKSLFAKNKQKPDKLPIQHYSNLLKEKVHPVSFSNVHGHELELYCGYKVALRKRSQKILRPYLFINFPMAPGDEIYIRILAIDSNYRKPGIFGFTNVRPSTFANSLETLPPHEPAALMDRKEYWLLREDPFDENLAELDEYRIFFDKTSGEILLERNKNQTTTPKILTFADPNQTFYPFLFLNGRITALSIFGLIAPNVHSLNSDLVDDADKQSNSARSENDDDSDQSICTICFDGRATVVLIPCGHLVFCTECKAKFEANSEQYCPKCRAAYERFIEIEFD